MPLAFDQNQTVTGPFVQLRTLLNETLMTQLFPRILFIALIGFAMSIAERAVAQSQPDTSRMTCAAAQALVMERGEIVLGTGPSLFDRYVSSRAYCTSTEL